jgi:peptidoglycan hydrolase-like protein with peptidoglycan-binding domain
MLTRNGAVLAIALLTLSPFSAAAATSVASSTATSSTPTITALQSLITQLEAEFAALVAAKEASATPAALSTHTHHLLTFSRVLSLGSKGADVSALQQMLKSAGFYFYPTITGYFGRLTEKALTAYQAAHGLTPVGYTGPKTRALLNGVAGAPGSVAQPAAPSPSASSPSSTATTATSSPPESTPLFAITPGYGGGGTVTTPPTISGTPSNMTAEASSAFGAAVTYTTPSATDYYGEADTVSCSPASGSTFALGTTTVTCSATNKFGNSSHSSFTVTVQDTTPPTITGTPSNSTAQATSPSGAIVTYSPPTAPDAVDGTDPVSCSPASGSTFALGVTTVSCTATDAHGNIAQTSFTVTVQDTSAPSIAITAPSNGTTVGGSSVTLTATASDNIVAVANVQFKVDGTNIGSAVTSSPYTITWNSKSVADGSHTLYAVAESASANYATSSVAISVRNSPPVLSSIATSSVATSTAIITWTTDEPATSQVNYGTTTSYGSASSSAALVTSHSITLTGLTASSTYDFQVQSVDAESNAAFSSNQTFVTVSAGAYGNGNYGSGNYGP